MASLYSHKLQECMHPNLSQSVLDSSQPLPKFNKKEIVPSVLFTTSTNNAYYRLIATLKMMTRYLLLILNHLKKVKRSFKM